MQTEYEPEHPILNRDTIVNLTETENLVGIKYPNKDVLEDMPVKDMEKQVQMLKDSIADFEKKLPELQNEAKKKNDKKEIKKLKKDAKNFPKERKKMIKKYETAIKKRSK